VAEEMAIRIVGASASVWHAVRWVAVRERKVNAQICSTMPNASGIDRKATPRCIFYVIADIRCSE
jgi:hypothetical protein